MMGHNIIQNKQIKTGTYSVVKMQSPKNMPLLDSVWTFLDKKRITTNTPSLAPLHPRSDITV